jgi:hypothetical protein
LTLEDLISAAIRTCETSIPGIDIQVVAGANFRFTDPSDTRAGTPYFAMEVSYDEDAYAAWCSARPGPQPSAQPITTPRVASSPGDRLASVRVEVLGSTQTGFINNPAIAVHWNGSKVGTVAHAGQFSFDIDGPGELLLKYAFRSRKVKLEPSGQTIRIQLSWDRTWGRLLAEQVPIR